MHPDSDIKPLVDQFPLPVMAWSGSDDRILSANEAALALYGWTLDELMGEPWQKLLADGPESTGAVQRHVRRDGTGIAVQLIRKPLSYEGSPLELIHIVDVSMWDRALTELKESKTFLEIAAQLGQLGAWSVDVPSMHHTWTEETRKIHGVPEGEHPSVDELIEFYHEDDRALIGEAVRACMEEGLPFDYRARMVRRDGDVRHVRANGMALQTATGDVYRILGGLQDITEENQAKLDLAASEERYRTLFENEHTIMLLIDPDAGVVVDANPAAVLFYGWSREELVGMPMSRINTLGPEEIAREMDRAKNRGHRHFEFRHRLKDGSVRDIDVFTGPVKQAGQTLLFAIVHDVTGQRQAEATLKLRGAALDAAANSIVITYSDGRIAWANAAFYRVSGYTAEEAFGKTPGQLIHSDQHDRAFYEEMWKRLKDGLPWTGEVINRMRDGRLLTEELTITPMLNEQGAITHYVGVKQDLTDRKLLEKVNLRSQRVESIGTLAAGIAHDLNNILAPILMAVDALKSGEQDQGRLWMLDRMDTSARRGAELVKQVLAFSRGTNSQQVVLNVAHIAKELEIIIQDTFPKSITFTSEYEEGLWLTKADPTHLHQVLMNLCVNARDAMPDGGQLSMRLYNEVVAETYMRSDSQPHSGRHVVLEIADTGTGIPADDLDRIFDPFYSTKEPGKGTGLGLPTVQNIISNHGGFLTVDSVVGKGTTFRAFLAGADDETGTDAVAPDVEIRTERQSTSRNILIADDEEPIRTMSSMMLEREGYVVQTASDGAEAVDLFRAQQDVIDLVILDGAMPVMDGMAALKAIRAIQPDARVLLSSGYINAESEAAYRKAGVTAFLPKPYTRSALLDAVASALE